MNKFDFSLYDDYEEPTSEETLPSIDKTKKSNFDFSLYDDEEPQQIEYDPVYENYRVKEYSPEELKKMSLSERKQYAEDLKTEREYLQSAGFVKSALSDLTFGFSERVEDLKPKDYESNQGLGSLFGSSIPIGAAFSLLNKGVNLIPKGYKWAKRAAKTLGAAGIGGGQEAIKQIGKEEEFDPSKIAVSAGAGAALDSLIRSIPGVGRWFKNLTNKQQEQILINRSQPENLSASSRKIYEEELVPILQEIGEQEYRTAYENAIKENNRIYEQEMANIRAKHENDLFKIQQVEIQNNKRTKEIEEANDLVMQGFEKSRENWQASQDRERLVQDAINESSKKSTSEKPIKASLGGEDSGIRPKKFQEEKIPLKNEIGKIISPSSIENPTVAGEKTVGAVRATAKADQKQVAKLYEKSDELNKNVVSTHPELVQELRGIVNQYKNKGNLTPQESQLLNNAETTLDKLLVFDEAGNAVGYKEVSNELLLDQAKVLRSQMYYDFAESNPTGIFNPLIDTYQGAAREAAISTGNEAAAKANDIARNAHSEWAKLYKNKYIKSFRNLSVDKPTALFESALGIDNYRQIDKVLSRTPSGQEISTQIRRELVNKKLARFYKNPKGSSLEEFNGALKELEPILKPGESTKIKDSFKNARKSSNIPAKKIEKLKEPTAELQKIPEKKNNQPTFVKLPQKKPIKITGDLKEAAKLMDISSDEAVKMTQSVSGLRKLKDKLSKTPRGERVLNEVHKTKVRDILKNGNIKAKYKGNDLFNVINKKNNFEILSEILGEEEAIQLLEASEKIGKNNMTRESLLKFTKNASLVKTAVFLGFF